MLAITKAFIAAMATTAVLAAPEMKARQSIPLTNCNFTLTSDIAVPAKTNLLSEFNFVIGRGLASLIPSNTGFFIEENTSTKTGGKTFNVNDSLGVNGKTAAQTATLLAGLTGTTRTGFATNPTINWTINSVKCEA